MTEPVLKDVLSCLQFSRQNVDIQAILPDRSNIFIDVKRCRATDLQQLEWLAASVEHEQDACPKTLVFATSINTVSDIYEWLMYRLRQKAYTNESVDTTTHLVSMFHAHISPCLQEYIMTEFRKPDSVVRVVVATIAFGMGVQIADVRRVVHWGKVSSLMAFWQQIGRCGRDGLPAHAIWYATSATGQDSKIFGAIKAGEQCQRHTLLAGFVIDKTTEQQLCCLQTSREQAVSCTLSCECCTCVLCTCCSVCKQNCPCSR